MIWNGILPLKAAKVFERMVIDNSFFSHILSPQIKETDLLELANTLAFLSGT